jgi:hypothetical protein
LCDKWQQRRILHACGDRNGCIIIVPLLNTLNEAIFRYSFAEKRINVKATRLLPKQTVFAGSFNVTFDITEFEIIAAYWAKDQIPVNV